MSGAEGKAKHGRSSVTNGKRPFLEPMLRTKEGRRFSDLLSEAEAERGGRAAMSVTAREAARHWATLAVQAEMMHAKAALGEAVDLEALGQIGDRMDRQARRMGPVQSVKAKNWAEHFAAQRAAKGKP